MGYEATILLGRISKIHGFEGAVTVKIDRSFVEKIPEMESVFLEIEGKPVPFFIEDYEYRGGDTIRLSFTGYDSYERVKEFSGCRIFLTSGDSATDKKEDLTFQGYTIILPEATLLGTIKAVTEKPGQWLLNVSTPEGKELLIPLHEDLIVSIDKRKKNIMMELPEGLLDIN
ncbi:MAG TPA: ribosome maturation factor RimM [Bacteroidales bacterium]|nr:ribosome maturation factor RimM [Bacteroidales bacterium]HPF04042.1 ribosome maturation factor RimM [Bacteroidales bacterium]HPJ59105.1 ribosome maturation factor RimM [Bacteroidales bacterium]HPR11404.1 ribosome maturation factor RimM [Bacteroidales bacterium]HRW85280.1 ribosome maturation factor RimM [Bacteroidales bacterium]